MTARSPGLAAEVEEHVEFIEIAIAHIECFRLHAEDGALIEQPRGLVATDDRQLDEFDA
ncbi:hypothetical protein [Bradyrhizobium sp. HKCCYLR20261]|uniref:hypothetical protein n=1 Tax=unclassified Bradyrhizobium TaxID=2631580 RepID=UPI003EB87EB4